MIEKTGGLRFVLTENCDIDAKRSLFGEIPSAGLLLAGISVSFAAIFPSAAFPWWIIFIVGMCLYGVFTALYGRKHGKYILPAAILFAGVFSAVFYKNVFSGLSFFGNDFLKTLTENTGRIYLDFASASEKNFVWAIVPIIILSSALVSRSVWRGSVIMLLPVVLPVLGLAVIGFTDVNAGIILILCGIALVLIKKASNENAGKAGHHGIPSYFVIVILCGVLAFGYGIIKGNAGESTALDEIKAFIHDARFDSDHLSMPEGELKNLGAWEKSSTPALEITMEEPEKMYLRGEIYDVYTGSSWEKADPKALSEYEDLFYWLHERGFYGQSQIGNISSLTSEEGAKNLTIENVGACSAHGYYPYAVCDGSTLDPMLIGDTLLPAVQELSYITGSVPEWYAVQQAAAENQGDPLVSAYLDYEEAYEKYVTETDLQLTEDSWNAINRQVETESYANTMSAILNFTRNWLSDNLEYNELAKTKNGNGDFLEYTFEQSGEGYSVHYATSAVLMLRYFGIPARYVEGYYISPEEAEGYKTGEEILLTENHAHAWAEYYLSGVGFVPFEVTPGYIDEDELNLGGNLIQNENFYKNENLQYAKVQQPEDIKDPEGGFSFKMKPIYILFIVLIVILALLIIVLIKRGKLKKALREIDEAPCRDAIAMRYGYAVCLLNHSEIEEPNGIEEAERLNKEALFSHHDMNEEQRKIMDDFASNVLNLCKDSWSVIKKLRYRIWDCLY